MKTLLGILQADHFAPELARKHGDYIALFRAMFESIGADIDYRVYAAVDGVLPKDPWECSAYLVTGSKHSVFEEEDWILGLCAFCGNLAEKRIKTVGICFGHQLVAHALGGRVERSEKGYGLGVREFNLTTHMPWMEPSLDSVALLYSHQDQVMELPTGATWLGGNDFCRNLMFCVDDHVLCIQGHPEFTRECLVDIMATRLERIGADPHRAAIESLARPTNELAVAQWINRFVSSVTDNTDHRLKIGAQ